MKSTRTLILALLAAAAAGGLPAQDPPATEAPAQSEMQKWFAATDAQWQAAFKRDVTDPYEAELEKLKLQYLKLLEDGISKASKTDDLDGALALRNEEKRFGDTQMIPEQDEPGDAAAVKRARAPIRSLLLQVGKNNVTRTKALHAKYDQMLAQAQAQLTQRGRLDDALFVKGKRDELAAAWIAPLVPEAPVGNTPSKEPQDPSPVARQMDDREARAIQGALASLNQALKKTAFVSSSLTLANVKRDAIRDISSAIEGATFELEPVWNRGTREEVKVTLKLASVECSSSNADVPRLRKLIEKAIEQLKPPAARIRNWPSDVGGADANFRFYCDDGYLNS